MSRSSDRSIPGGEFILDYYGKDPRPIWGEESEVLWMPGEPTMIVASEGTGKSTLAQQLTLRRIGVISEPSFLGYSVAPLKRPGLKVLYLAMDRPRQIARSFGRMVTPSHRQRLNDRLRVWSGPPPVNLGGSPKDLAEWVAEDFPRTRDVVIDSLKDLAVGLAADETGAAVNTAIQELIARGYNVLTLHHNRKVPNGESRRQRSLDDVYGSRWLTGGHGSVIWLDGKPGANTVELIHLKPIVDVVPNFKIVHDHARGASSVFHGDTDLVELLLANAEDGVTLEQASLHLFKVADENAKQRTRRALAKLVTEQTARNEPGAAGGKGGGGKEGRWFPIIR